jgi:two-component system, chemotaxis family, chemotaxis protein CheY
MIKILVIDDAIFMRKLIKDALAPLGVEIVGEAANGKIGLEMFHRLQPDLVTLDIVMPEMDGLQTLEAIRSTHPKFPVIMISALDQREQMLKAMNLGASEFIVKPFDHARVASAVNNALERSRA